jgi:hypothetical protein
MSIGTVQQYMGKTNLSAFYDPNDPLTPIYKNLVAMYANPKSKDDPIFIEACLRARQIIYYHKSPGDCGAASGKVSVGPQGKIGQGLGLAGGTVGTLASTFGGISAIGVAAGPLALAAIPFVVWGIFKAHHAAAVANEQATLCDVTLYINQNLIDISNANIDWMTKKKALDQVQTQALSHADLIKKTCNAACVIETGIKALHDLFVQLYGTPPPSNPIPAPVAGLFGYTGATPAGPTATNAQGGAIVPNPLSGAGGAAAVGAGLVGLHFVGAF